MSNDARNNPIVDRENRKTRYDPTESGAMDEAAKPRQVDPPPRQLSPEEQARADEVLRQSNQGEPSRGA